MSRKSNLPCTSSTDIKFRSIRAARSHNANLAPLSNYVLSVTAGVRAGSEAQAWRRLGKTLVARASSKRALVDKSVTELEAACERAELKPKNGRLDRQAIYKEHRFYQGGAARPR
jgi:hypothetical protein